MAVQATLEPARVKNTAASPARSCGAVRQTDGSVRWRVWAPAVKDVTLVLFDGDGRELTFALDREEANASAPGHFAITLPDIAEGQRYGYRLGDAEDLRPDPCSLWQPDGVAGPSAVFSPDRFAWTDGDWRGIERSKLAIYELHIGTFTAAGTFESTIERLDDLAELGITAIEVMPVAQFPGSRNWGYDGVLPYAAQDTYGGPPGLQRLVDAAHAKGLAVILDVVYNHLGPEHSYVREFGPYFTEKYKTPWGAAINYDDRGSDGVRDWILDNVRMWLDEFHLDALRLDAVHAIFDTGAKHVLREVHEVSVEVAQRTGRHVTIIAESDLNDPRIINAPAVGGHGLDAQWSDDFHHAVHAFLTGERRGYYMEYGDPADLAKTLNAPFLTTGQYSRERGRRHGASPDGLGGDKFIVCIQNHDQVGNRAVGDRHTTIFGKGEHGQAKLRLAACLMLFAPHLPMLFMGEEYAEERPFPFFCSFGGKELIQAVRKGRKREFAHFVDDPDAIPDPDAATTFESAKLSWSWPAGSNRAAIRAMYKDLLAARRRWPALQDFENRLATPRGGADGDVKIILLVRGGTASGDRTLDVYFNVTDATQPLPDRRPGRSLLFSSEHASYGGTRQPTTDVRELRPFECVAFGPASWGEAGAR